MIFQNISWEDIKMEMEDWLDELKPGEILNVEIKELKENYQLKIFKEYDLK